MHKSVISGTTRILRILPGVLAFALICGVASAERHHLILCGSGGDDEYRKKFIEWGTTLRDALIETCGDSPEFVTLMTELPEGEGAPGPTSTREAILAHLTDLSGRVGEDDELFVYLLGHGSHLRRISKFHVPGPDLKASDVKSALDSIAARRIVLINGSSSSAGFINELSGEGRIVVSATKSVSEANATHFMGFFVQALAEGSGDQNRDDRISILELSQQATLLTDAWFVGEGLIQTEHALIDDNGDGLGSRLAELDEDREAERRANPDVPSTLDGRLAEACYLKDFSFPEWIPKDLVSRYLDSLSEIQEYKNRKGRMENNEYYGGLERLLVDASQASQAIRYLMDLEAAPDSPAGR